MCEWVSMRVNEWTTIKSSMQLLPPPLQFSGRQRHFVKCLLHLRIFFIADAVFVFTCFCFLWQKNNNKTTRKDNPKTKNPTGLLILQHRIKELQGVGWDVYLRKQSTSNQTSSRGKGKGCLEIESFPGCLSWDVDVKCYVSAILEISSDLRSKQLFPLINHACTG